MTAPDDELPPGLSEVAVGALAVPVHCTPESWDEEPSAVGAKRKLHAFAAAERPPPAADTAADVIEEPRGAPSPTPAEVPCRDKGALCSLPGDCAGATPDASDATAFAAPVPPSVPPKRPRAKSAPRANAIPAALVFTLDEPRMNDVSASVNGLPPLAAVFARIPRKPAPLDADDTVQRAALAAVACAPLPHVGWLPSGCVPVALDFAGATCAGLIEMDLSEQATRMLALLDDLPPTDVPSRAELSDAVVACGELPAQHADAASHGPAAGDLARSGAQVAPASRARSPDLFSSSDDEANDVPLAAAAPDPTAEALMKRVAAEPAPGARVALAEAQRAALAAALRDPCALAAAVVAADPFLASLAALLCA